MTKIPQANLTYGPRGPSLVFQQFELKVVKKSETHIVTTNINIMHNKYLKVDEACPMEELPAYNSRCFDTEKDLQ